MKKFIQSFFKKRSPYIFFVKLFARVGKRKRFIIASLFLTTVILASSFFSFDEAEYFLVLLLVCVYLMTFFAILEGIDRIEWLMLFLVPLYFTLAFYMFYFFLPGRWLTRLPYVTIYAVSIYAILLSSNIFHVGATKNLQLFRAAFSVNYLFLTLISFLVFSVIISFRLHAIANFLLFLIVSLPLTLQFLWSIDPSTSLKRELFGFAFVISLAIAEFGLVFSFTPVRSAILALFLTSQFYSMAGLFHAYIENMLFRERIREYVIVLVFVFVITVLSIQWTI